jgi:hypothetical protein
LWEKGIHNCWNTHIVVRQLVVQLIKERIF